MIWRELSDKQFWNDNNLPMKLPP